MIKSMTGFGVSSMETADFAVTVEAKSLNSKSLDLNLRIPKSINDKEFEIRALVSSQLERGKVNIGIEYTPKGESKPKLTVNKAIVKAYYNDLLAIANEVNADTKDLLRTALTLPDAYVSEKDNEDNEAQWFVIAEVIHKALQECNQFRLDEGNKLMQDLTQNINKIETLLAEIVAQDPTRVANVREKLRKQVEELIDNKQYDQNRFEQELIYYIEKLDINEEKVRLKTHLDYFRQTLASDEANGKKLGFIGQEIGREINTIGSKANDAVVQKLVIQMKEELEKIKEQSLNVL
jgi:uncharacterized protein (TIGR00255 family)